MTTKTKICSRCRKEKELKQGVWRWALRHGFYGSMCHACALAKYRAGNARQKRDNAPRIKKLKKRIASLERTNEQLRRATKRVLEDADGY